MRLTVISKNTIGQTIGKIITSGSSFIITIIIARTYGSALYGEYIKIISFTTLFYLFVDFGINALYIQNHTKANKPSYFFSLLLLRLLLALLASVLAALFLMALPAGSADSGFTAFSKVGIFLSLPLISLQAVILSCMAEIQMQLRYTESSKAAVISSALLIVSIIAITLLVKNSDGIYLSIIALMFSMAMQIVLLSRIVHKALHQVPAHVSLQESSALFVASVPLGLIFMASLLYSKVDTLILSLIRPTIEVGWYGLSYRVFEVSLAISSFYCNSLYPTLVAKKHALTKNPKKDSVKNAFVIGLFCTILTIALSPLLPIIRPEFAFALPSLWILSTGIPIFFVSNVYLWFLISVKQWKWLFYIYAVAMVLSILCNLFFVPTYGYIASSCITIVLEIAVCLALYWANYANEISGSVSI